MTEATAPLTAANARVDTLLEIASTINSELDLDRLFWVIYEQCSRIFDTRNFLLVTSDPDGGNAQVRVWFYRGRRLTQADLRDGQLQGLSPEVLRTHRPVVVADYLAALAERRLPIPAPTDPTEHLAWMGVPIRIADRMIGVLSTSRPHLPYAEADVRLLAAIAAQCAVAIENARLLDIVSETARELMRRTTELRGLNLIAAAVNRSLDLPTVLERGVEAVRRVSGWEMAVVRLRDAATGTWEQGVEAGLPADTWRAGTIEPDRPIFPYVAQMLREQRPVLLDTAADPGLTAYRGLARHGVLFPLQIGGEVLGFLLLGTRNPIPETGPGAMLTDQTLLAIGDQLAMAVKNARLLTDVQTARGHIAAVLQATADGMIFYDRATRVEMANPAIDAVFGLPRGSLIGQQATRVAELIRPCVKDPALVDEIGRRLREEPAGTDTMEIELTYPERRIFRRVMTPVRDEQGELIGRLVAYHDITEAKDLARRTQELAGLNAVATAVNRSFDLQTVLARAADSLLTVTGWDTVTIRLWNPAERTWDLGVRRGPPIFGSGPGWDDGGAASHPIYPRANKDILAGRPAVVHFTGDPAFDFYSAAGLLCLACLPIQMRGQVLGVVVLGTVRPEVEAGAEALPADATLAAICEQLAVAIENGRLHTQAQQAAALEERHRLARELHDSVTQSLFTVTLMAEAAQALIERDPQRVAAYLERLKDTAHSALAEMRALLDQLRPQGLRASGLGAALRRHAETVGAQVGLPVTVQIDATLPELPPAVEEAIYRIAQEALHNVIKHAQATHAEVCLQAERPRVDGPASAVTLTVTDDGHGLASPAPAAGLGLTNMRERAAGLGGNFAIGPRSDGPGAVITVAIPLA